MSDCVFCEIVAGDAPAKIVDDTKHTLGIIPLNPVTNGHVIILPKQHVENALVVPGLTADVMHAALDYAVLRHGFGASMNFITSVGSAATQTIKHLHIHLVPRYEGDGLKLPWSEQQIEAEYGRRFGD